MEMIHIVPNAHLELTEVQDMHMCLTHLVLQEGNEEYVAFYKKEAHKGKYIIMDNSVVEVDHPFELQDVIKAARKVHAREIILPDVLRDCEATLELTSEAIGTARMLAPDLKLMAVPQGKDVEEWLECCELMLAMDIDVIGIPKWLGAFGELTRVEVLATLGHKLKGREIHLLGCWKGPREYYEIIELEQDGIIAPVRSTDSALAFAYARADKLIMPPFNRPPGAIDFINGKACRGMMIANMSEILTYTTPGAKYDFEGKGTAIPMNVVNFRKRK